MDPRLVGSFFSSLLLPTGDEMDQLRRSLRSTAPASLLIYDLLREILNRMVSERAVLAEYSDGCRSLLAPVRRLPTEVLVEIFALCRPESKPAYITWGSTSLATTMERAAQSYLLQLSQVCSSWYTTVMGTPSLWANIDAFCTSMTTSQEELFRDLLNLSIQRSVDFSLSISIYTCFGNCASALQLLAQNSSRWRRADIWIDDSSFQIFAVAKANLPLLEYLSLGGMRLQTLDIFEDAPRLTKIKMGEMEETPLALPWRQLRSFTYESARSMDLGNGLPVMCRLSTDCGFGIYNLDIDDTATANLEPVTADICIFHMTLITCIGAEHARICTSEILATLTFPNLRGLFFASGVIDNPLSWPREPFLAFASRCSTRSNLTQLSLHDTVISEEDLFECIAEMPILHELFIQDIPSWVADGADHILLTSGLFQRLTWTSDPTCLVPRLVIFDFSSFFTFDEGVWLDFVESRVVPGRDEFGSFEMKTLWLTPATPELDEPVLDRMSELDEQREVYWTFGADPERPIERHAS
ncbi:hypothetical protein B0H11DRAFT_2224846 [Mycena galericulata]|nr:hypothetical protein B0H11DRAFT_2224846 [Mycena galericulata]